MGANELLKELIKEEINKQKVEYFANLLKNGINVEIIQKGLKISDSDYSSIYSSALKLLQQDVDEVIK